MRAIAIFFLSLQLLEFSGTGELLKLPLLITHYNEHLSLNSDVSFSEFLVEHYIIDDGNPNDNDRDRRLPFRSSETAQHIMPPALPMLLEEDAYCSESKFFVTIFPQENLLSSELSPCWQPPELS